MSLDFHDHAAEINYSSIDFPGKPPIFPLDQEISLGLHYAKRTVAWLRTSMANDRDALIMRSLARTRKNNKRARAYAEMPGELE